MRIPGQAEMMHVYKLSPTCSDEPLAACLSACCCCSGPELPSGAAALLPACGADREALIDRGSGDSGAPLSGTV